MKTRFQTSITWGWSAFTSSDPGRAFRSASLRMSTWISEHGPQGPVSPISQKLSFRLKGMIRSSGRCFFHRSRASVSGSRPSASSPPK